MLIAEILVSLCRIVWSSIVATLSCSVTRRKVNKPILPTIHIAAPSPVLSADDKDIVITESTSLPDNATWRSSWQADKARFMEHPNLILGEFPNSKAHQRTRSHRISTLSDSDPGTGTTECIPLEVKEPTVSSSGLPVSGSGNCTDQHVETARKPRLNPFGARKPPRNPKLPINSSVLLGSGRCYRPDPLSALSGNLYDAAPTVVNNKDYRSTRELVPYPDLFDFSVYDRRASARRSDLVPRSGLDDKENDRPFANTRSCIPREDFTKADPSAYVSSGPGILTPPALFSAKRFGVLTGTRTKTPTAMFFGTASILNSVGAGTGAGTGTSADHEDPVATSSHDLIDVPLH